MILGLISGIFLVIVLFSLKKDIQELSIFTEYWPLIIVFVCTCLVIWIYGFYFFASKWATALQFSKFIAVGQSNAAIDIGVLNLLILISNIDTGIYFSIFKGTSFIFAIVNSFLWNKFWSFESKEKDGMGKQFMKFIAVALVGLLINVSVASIVVNYIGPQWGISSRLWANVGVLSSAVFNIIWDFYGYKVHVFKK
jgi:putative flippase GtrA